MLRRVTTPKTIYKKQKLDRDDIVDITDLDIVAWLKAEMRVMLDEELAAAVLVSDGRDADDEDKIDEDSIRPIAYDIDMYNTTIQLDADFDSADLIDAVVTGMKNYKGSGQPTMYTTTDVVTPMILAKDTLGRRLYSTMEELAAALRVKEIVEVEAMERDTDLVCVIVNLADYTIGADNGGNVAMFEDFDIDYNQQKYLLETRVSGALTRPKSAITFTKNSGRIVTPTAPTFVASTGVLTVPTQTGVVYQNADTGATLTAGAQTAIAPGATIDVVAVPATGYGFTHDSETEWAFQRDAS
jgi:HK97 family phage major capsid protein